MSSRSERTSLVRRLGREGGQVLPLTALMMVVLIGFAGLVIDIGRVWIAQRQLQNAVDAAAAIAGTDMPNSQIAYTDAVTFDGYNTGASIGKNALTGYGVTSSSAGNPLQVTFECVTNVSGLPPCDPDSSNDNCKPAGAQAPQPAGTTTCNAVKVTETASVKATFARLFIPSFTVSASATAGARGGTPHPLDIAVVVDSTASMDTNSCGDNVPGIPNGRALRIDCAKEGVRTLLQGLWPCDSSYQSCGGVTPLDETSLLTFPALSNPNAFTHDKTSTLTNNALEMQCEGSFSGSGPAWYKPSGGFPDWYIDTSDLTYNGSPSYVVTPLSNDYKANATTTTLTTSSPLVDAVSWDTCPNQLYPGNEYYGLNARGGVNTYYADAIKAAQAELAADSARGAQPVIILLSDGDANTKSPGQCTRAVNNAVAAANAGTWVYSVMYGQTSTNGGCSGDGAYTAYTAMKAIARNSTTPNVPDPSKFFCDPKPAGATCQSAATLNDIFQHIAIDLTDSRLIG